MISSATIRVENSRTVVDAVVDGTERDGWVIYDGDSIEHEQAAIAYLIGAGVALGNIEIAGQEWAA